MAATIRCAGESNRGQVRENNEDRLYFDQERGIFMVVDGMGGEAAGEVAAATAVEVLCKRLERDSGTPEERIREGIALANNAIYEKAQANEAWRGMACVLTVACVDDGLATVGHIGDTRLYKILGGQITKVTPDHSPVGELEDAGQLSEIEAMRHPRRNEVLRDVGSSPREPDDEGFVDIIQIPFEPNSALLMCSDGLSDLVSSSEMLQAIKRHLGNRSRVVRQLIDLANENGGKDNVTVLFIEGSQFAPAMRRQLAGLPEPGPAPGLAEATRPGKSLEPSRTEARPRAGSRVPPAFGRALGGRAAFLIYGILLGALTGAAWYVARGRLPRPDRETMEAARRPARLVVGAEGLPTIGAALARARPGDVIEVPPAEYSEQLRLKDGVTLVSQRPHEAVIRLGGGPEEADIPAAVTAEGVRGGRFVGFRIQGEGDQVAVGLRLLDTDLEVEDVDISGATEAAVEVSGTSTASIRSSHIHDNRGTGIVVVGDAATPRVVNNYITANGLSPERPGAGLEVLGAASPVVLRNVIKGNGGDDIAWPSEERRRDAFRQNIVGDSGQTQPGSGPMATQPQPERALTQSRQGSAAHRIGR